MEVWLYPAYSISHETPLGKPTDSNFTVTGVVITPPIVVALLFKLIEILLEPGNSYKYSLITQAVCYGNTVYSAEPPLFGTVSPGTLVQIDWEADYNVPC